MFFQSLTAAFNCYKFQYLLLQFFLSIMLGHFFFLTVTRKPTRLTHINATMNRHDVLHPSEQQPLIGCVLISHATRLASTSKDFYYRTFNRGSVRSVGKACDCRAGGRGFHSWGRINTQGLKITEKVLPLYFKRLDFRVARVTT